MTTYTESNRPLEFLAWEADPQISREKVTLTAAQGDLKAGMVMAKVTGTGNYVPYDDDANAGTAGVGIAAGILAYDAPNNAATQSITIIARLAVVKNDLLLWEASNDAGEKTAAAADLLALNIIVR